jgi:putative membrane protein
MANGPGLEGRSAEDTSFQLSSRRTRLSFQRTRMSADRTLMSIIRTALSLIGFGFTIFQFFRFLRHSTDVAVNVSIVAHVGPFS